MLGGDPSLDPLKQLVIERTDGNPFFVEETVRTLVETGLLAGAPGAYRLTGEARQHPGAADGARGRWRRASTGSRPRTRACSRTRR